MAQDTQYGGFWVRFVALVLDYAIVFLIMLAALFALLAVKATVGMDSTVELIASLVLSFAPYFYWPVMESSGWQATVGKRVMGLEVTDADGNRLSFPRALLRSLAKIISGIPIGIGFLIAAFTARKQALHDIIVKTLVVRTGPSQLWKAIVALVVGFVVMIASGAGLFYYVLMPMLDKDAQGTMTETTKGAPQMKTIPAPAPATAPRPAPAAVPAPAPAAAPAPAPAAAPAPVIDAPVTPKTVPVKPRPKPGAEPKAASSASPAPARTPAAEAAPAPARPPSQGGPECVYKPVMTDEEIARCR